MELAKKLRILYHHRTRGDGAEGVHINEMVEAFRELGHTVHCCCPPSAKRPPGLTMGMTGTASAKSQGWIGWTRIAFRQSLELAYNAVSLARISRELKQFRPDLIYERYSCYHVAGARASRTHKVPFILEVNSTYTGRFNRRQLAFPKTAARLESFALHQAKVVAVVSRPLKECVQDRGIPSERIVVTPNAVNDRVIRSLQLDPQAIRGQLGIDQDAVVIGFVGSLRQWHGVDMLMRAIPQVVQRVPNAVFLIVGSGELESDLKELHRKPELENRLILTGGVPHSKVYEFIASMDIGLMPHSNQWGSPMKILEYMALGKLCIAPRIAPIEEIVQDGVTGILFPEGNESAFIEAMIKACLHYDTRVRVGQNAKDYVLANRRWSDNVRIVLAAHASSSIESSETRAGRRLQ